jgi:hypothetical protein
MHFLVSEMKLVVTQEGRCGVNVSSIFTRFRTFRIKMSHRPLLFFQVIKNNSLHFLRFFGIKVVMHFGGTYFLQQHKNTVGYLKKCRDVHLTSLKRQTKDLII